MELIKKYSNRKMYSSKTKSYLTLTDLVKKVQKAEKFVVMDNKTKEDITSKTLKACLAHSTLSDNEVEEILKRV